MKKILLCLCLLAGFSVASDKSGVFIGVELGLNEMNNKSVETGASTKTKYSAPMYGVRAGYKGFFNDYIGLAGYLSFKDSFFTSSTDGVKTDEHFMPIMANIDFLLDFYSGSEASYGAFIGIGLGGAIFTYSDNGEATAAKQSIAGFYSDAKIGLTAGFGHNQISLIASFPFTEIKGTIDGMENRLKQNYIVSFAYDFKF